MAKQAPNPIDVQDFQFKLHCRLKIFTNEDNSVFNKPCSLLATANRFGLIFVGTASPSFQGMHHMNSWPILSLQTLKEAFSVIQVNSIEKHTAKDGEITNYNRRTIGLPSPPKHLAVNCDTTKLAVVVEKYGCPIGLIYDVASVMKQDCPVLSEIRLSPTPGVNVIETSWNPSIPNIFTACKDDGTLGLYELKEASIDINELPPESKSSCMCWSPKGKQIAVGSLDGKITQYKPELKAMKAVNAPALEVPHSVIAIQWISNYQFIALYKPQNTDGGASLLVVDSPKNGETVYTNYEDICYSYGNMRPMQFYLVHQAVWNILMVASANSMEVGVLGNEKEQWTQWILADAARAELPLSASKQETMPVGLAFNTSAVEPVLWGEASLPPAPFLLLLSHHGLLCCFRVIHIKSGISTICQAPERFADTSGLNQFKAPGPAVELKIPEPPKPVHLAAPIPELAAAPVLGSLPLPIPSFTATPQLSQPPLFSTPPAQFGAQSTFAAPKPEAPPLFKPDPQQPPVVPVAQQPPLSVAKSVPQNLFGSLGQQQITPAATATAAPAAKAVAAVSSAISASAQASEANVAQEEGDLLIGKLVREECEALEVELKALLHKGRSMKIDLGSDSEAVELVHGTDMLQDFLTEVTETSAVQGAEVHSLKQGLIQTWAWYEDARSRFAQTQDATLEALLRIQQLDPVSQRYLADIQHMTYYLESQLMQAGRSLDERWENFQDSCKKIVRLKIPTMEAIYQTMVRQSVVYQKQKYVLKDLSSRIRAHRSKINGPSLFVSLNDADQLERELKRLQLEPQHLFQAQYERVVQNQKRLTSNKIHKLGKLLLEREITRVTVSKPQLSNTLQSLIQSSVASASQIQSHKAAPDSSVLLGAALSPIFSSKPIAPRTVEFTQSTPKPAVHIEQKQNYGLAVTSGIDILKELPPGLSIKFTSTAPTLSTIPVVHEHLPSSLTSSTAAKSEVAAPAVTAPLSFKFSTIPSASVPTLSSSNNQPVLNQTSSTPQLNFLQFTTPPKESSTRAPITITPISQATSSQPSPLNLSAAKPAMSFGSLFGTTKSPSTFNFTFTSPSTASTTSAQASNTKPLASTASSAFVPTTQQLGFNFSAKSTPNSTVSSSALSSSTLTKPAFVFGTAAPALSSASATKTVVASDASKTISASSIALVTTPSTTSVTVVANVTSSASVPVFSLFKAPSVVQPTTVPVTAPKVAEIVSQGVSAPKSAASTALIPQSVAISLVSIPSTGATSVVSSTSNDNKVVTAAQSTVSSSQGPFFGTATTVSSESINFGTTVAKTIPSFTASSASIFGGGTSGASTITLKSSESVSQPSIFAKAAETASSVFATAAKSTSIFSAPTTATASESIFGASTLTAAGSFLGGSTAQPTLSNTTTTATGSLFSQAPGVATTSSIFGGITAQQGSSQSVASNPPFTAAAATSTGIFGSTAATITTTTASVFSPTTTTSSSGFGAPPPTPSFGLAATLASPVFGATTTSAAIFPTPGFGTSTTSSIFVQPDSTTTSSFATPASSVFGGTPKTTGAPFGSPAFPNNTNAFAGSSSFGSTTTASGSLFAQPAAFGGSVFGAPVSSSANAFGNATAANPTFGSGSSVFGTPTNSVSSDFSQSQSSSFSFAAAAANVPATNSAFGFSKPSGFGFGSAPPSTNSSSFSFGNLNMGAATTSANTAFASGFGQTSNSNPFAKVVAQEQKSAFGGGSLFGTPATTTTTSIFGGGASNSGFGNPAPFGSPPGFGSPSTFGQQSTFPAAQNSFGNSFGSPSQPGPFSGGNQSVSQTGFGSFGQVQKPAGFSAAPVFGGSPGGFGSPPAFGSTSPAFGGAPAFGTPPKVFGNSPSTTGTFGVAPQQQNPTFANLATQNTLGFGALAQQSQPAQSSSPFSGGSSFSTWR